MSDQGFGRSDLPGCRTFFVEIADQADADSVFVDLVTTCVAAMDALFLARPSLGNLDLAIAAAGSVADHEMIAAAIQAEDLTVFGVDLFIVAAVRGAVMENDVPPGAVGLVGVDQIVGA